MKKKLKEPLVIEEDMVRLGVIITYLGAAAAGEHKV
jgi:hypothetical protein